MIRYIVPALALSALVLSGCGGQTPAPTPAPPADAPAPAPVTVEVEAPPAAPAPEMDGAATPPAPAEAAPADASATPAEGAADANHQALIGTTWLVGEYTATFKDATTVALNGGQLTMLTGGKGLDGKYTYKDGAIEVSAMGQTKNGTWDGTNLTMDGAPATKQ